MSETVCVCVLLWFVPPPSHALDMCALQLQLSRQGVMLGSLGSSVRLHGPVNARHDQLT